MVPRLITLATDFGYRDPSVGIMKGVILGISPQARIVDLSHGLPPQDLIAAALALYGSVPFFPCGTIHVAVVDPGVGTERAAILIEAQGSFLIGPDNGIFGPVLDEKRPEKIIALTNDFYHIKPTSATFHGRDIFAPVAGHLSLGVPPEAFGNPVHTIEKLRWPTVSKTEQGVQGEIIYIDHFGNLITNVRACDLKAFPSDRFTLQLGDVSIAGIAHNYASARDGEYVAVLDSWGMLEIAVFKGNAHLSSGANVGDKFDIRKIGPPEEAP
ncbi:MAG: SAM-dependent chlorinase/fluorinase [Deltaproteobacteria bacterium]|nr:SAM-dependent chlorinase/fluorinase [Deltaproteobacteria bacterium]